MSDAAEASGTEAFRGWLEAAREQAEKSWGEGGIPIGSVLVNTQGEIVSLIIVLSHKEQLASSVRVLDAEGAQAF